MRTEVDVRGRGFMRPPSTTRAFATEPRPAAFSFAWDRKVFTDQHSALIQLSEPPMHALYGTGEMLLLELITGPLCPLPPGLYAASAAVMLGLIKEAEAKEELEEHAHFLSFM